MEAGRPIPAPLSGTVREVATAAHRIDRRAAALEQVPHRIPVEITGWSNNSGFPLTYQDQIAYNRAVAGWVHAAGMSVLLKGDLEQAHDLVGDFDFTLNEECFQYDECTTVSNEGPGADGKDYPGLQLFVQANKAVFIAEYQTRSASAWSTICATSQAQHFNTSLYVLGLPTNGGRTPCRTSAPDRW